MHQYEDRENKAEDTGESEDHISPRFLASSYAEVFIGFQLEEPHHAPRREQKHNGDANQPERLPSPLTPNGRYQIETGLFD